MIYKIFSPSRDIMLTTPLETEEEAARIAQAISKSYPGAPDWDYVEWTEE